MQEIRDFLYGTKEQLFYLHGYERDKRKPKYLECGQAINLEKAIPKLLDSYVRFEILGSSLWENFQETISPLIPSKLLRDVTSLSIYSEASREGNEFIYSVWWIPSNENRWVKLLDRLPTEDELLGLAYSKIFDVIRVCKYTPKLACIESCDMIIKGNNKPRRDDTFRAFKLVYI
jgi:hypothetical protein